MEAGGRPLETTGGLPLLEVDRLPLEVTGGLPLLEVDRLPLEATGGLPLEGAEPGRLPPSEVRE